MSYSPATPDKSFKDSSVYSTKIAVPALEKLSTSKVKQSSHHEPSPASTYGDTAAGDSVPATPQQIDGKLFVFSYLPFVGFCTLQVPSICINLFFVN